jgi:hypothetical protein
MVDLIEIYVHWFAGRSKSEIAASLGVDRGTLRKYVAPAEAAGIRPGRRCRPARGAGHPDVVWDGRCLGHLITIRTIRMHR